MGKYMNMHQHTEHFAHNTLTTHLAHVVQKCKKRKKSIWMVVSVKCQIGNRIEPFPCPEHCCHVDVTVVNY